MPENHEDESKPKTPSESVRDATREFQAKMKAASDRLKGFNDNVEAARGALVNPDQFREPDLSEIVEQADFVIPSVSDQIDGAADRIVEAIGKPGQPQASGRNKREWDPVSANQPVRDELRRREEEIGECDNDEALAKALRGITREQISKATTAPTGTVSSTKAWNAFKARRDALRPAKRIQGGKKVEDFAAYQDWDSVEKQQKHEEEHPSEGLY